jgi:hypothetical protein
MIDQLCSVLWVQLPNKECTWVLIVPVTTRLIMMCEFHYLPELVIISHAKKYRSSKHLETLKAKLCQKNP